MRRRRFLTTAASAASAVAAAPLVSLVGCGDASSGEPLPVPPSDVVLRLPQDMYAHPGAPTEWWWHIGTLRAGERVFGFEINAASFAGQGFAFTQVMLSDVARDAHYQRTTPFVPPVFSPSGWAESDPAKDWYARLGSADSKLNALAVLEPGSGYTSAPQVEITGGGGSGAAALATLDPATGGVANVVLVSAGSGYTSEPEVRIVGGGGSGAVVRALHTYVAMDAPQGDPTQDIHVQALLVDDPSLTEVRFDLRFSQQGRPFFVWGTGINPGGSGHDLQTNNFYFSLTRLAASGTIELGGETFAVDGTTWMDHEYGAFGTAANPVKWFLQDMQLDDGTCISNYSTVEQGLPALGERRPSTATIQDASGSIWYVPTFVTAIDRTWTSPVSGATYFMKLRVEIPSFDADLVVESLMDAQEFPVVGSPVYEGVASAEGTFRGRRVRGTAWNEQDL
jgi:predicted secreted hydrolase